MHICDILYQQVLLLILLLLLLLLVFPVLRVPLGFHLLLPVCLCFVGMLRSDDVEAHSCCTFLGRQINI